MPAQQEIGQENIEAGETPIEKPLDTGGTRKPLILLVAGLVVIVAILIGLYALSTYKSAGTLRYIPYDRVEEVVGKGYTFMAFVYKYNTEIAPTKSNNSITRLIAKSDVSIVAIIIGRGSLFRATYIVGFKGSPGLLNDVASELNKSSLIGSKPTLKDGFRIWVSPYGNEIMLADNDGSLVFYVENRGIDFSTDYIINLTISFAKSLSGHSLWSCKDSNLNSLIYSVPADYRSSNVAFFKNTTGVGIVFTKQFLSLSLSEEEIEGYMIVSRPLEQSLKKDTYTVEKSLGDYLLLKLESKTASIT